MSGLALVLGSGQLGAPIARQLASSGRDVVVGVHRGSKRTAAALPASARVVEIDLCESDGLDALPSDGVALIVHAAAMTRFDASLDDARRVNVEGTRRVLAFASRCRRLERVTVLSSVHVAGLSLGETPEAILPRLEAFANAYEQSRWEAESLVAASDVPWALARTGTVIADDATGAIGQPGAIHLGLRMLAAGLLPVVPGRASTLLPLVTAESAARECARLASSAPAGAVVHVAPRREACVTLEGFLAVALEAMQEREDVRARGVLPPLLVDLAEFEALREQVGVFGGSLARSAMDALSPVAAQLLAPKWPATRVRDAVLAGHDLDLAVSDALLRSVALRLITQRCNNDR